MSTPARRLIDALLTGDVPSAVDLLAPEASFHSPIRDYAGHDRIESVWRAVAGVVQDARLISVHERDSETLAVFVGTIIDQPIDGVLRTLSDGENRVSDVTLMIRPWAALRAGLATIPA